MESQKKTGDNGGVASGEVAKKAEKRKRKKGGAYSMRNVQTDAAEDAVIVLDEEISRADSPPAQVDTVVLHTSDETSPVASSSKKAKVATEKQMEAKEEKEEKSTFEDEDSDHLRPFFVKGERPRRSSLVGESLEEVKKVVRLFKANLDTMADDIWECRNPGCAECVSACTRLDTFYKMTCRMLSMLVHREQEAESKMAAEEGRTVAAERRASELEIQRVQLEEERSSLQGQLEELRRRTPARAEVVDAATSTSSAQVEVGTATSTKDVQTETETEAPVAQVSADPGLLKAIDDIVVRRLREMGGLGRRGSERVDGASGATTPLPDLGEDTWARKVGRRTPGRGRREEKRGGAMATSTPLRVGKERKSGPPGKAGKKVEEKTTNRRWPVPPKTAAVTVTIPPGSTTTYAEVMAAARREIPLEDLGIPHVEVRRAKTGGLILGVAGEGAAEKADRLAARLSGSVAAAGARIARPTRRLDLRITGLDASMTAGEVATAVAEAGGCRGEEVRCGRPGGSSSSGRTALWVQCPMTAALQVARMGSIKVGWVRATVELLPARPLRCYRCLELGHMRAQCKSEVSREARCYRCGGVGHGAKECAAAPNCPLCADSGRPAAHSLGGAGCVERVAPPAPQATRDDNRPP